MNRTAESFFILLVVAAMFAIFAVILSEAVDKTLRHADAKIAAHIGQMPADVRETLAK